MAPLVEEEDDEERESVSFTSKPKTETVTPGFTNPNVQNWMNAPSEDEEDEDEDEDE